MKWTLIFIGFPIVELYVLFKINEIIGIMYTISIIILTAIIGSFFVKDQAMGVFFNLKENKGNPLLSISHGLIILLAGVLLLTPGFITDAIGFLLLIAKIRKFFIAEFSKRIRSKL